ncbi:MAG: Trk system potassium transporter TrkA [Alphaproteobacteria bacterium]|nr:Trk system potassium transporter TrkA [Alphaproteobacteria bacterium]
MRVIVCGAGQVGSNIARQLSTENNHVTVIDQSPELIRKVSDSLDVTALVGFASYPNVLERAGAAEADMLIAVTFADEVNMVACQVAHSLFNLPTKIARVRNPSYLEPIWADLFSRDNLPIDVIISPEIEVARAIHHRLAVPGAFDMIPLAGGRIRVVGVRCGEDCPILDTPLRQLTELFPELHMVIVAIVRGNKPFIPSSDEVLMPGDDVYFVADSEHVGRALATMGHEEDQAHRHVIIGGGNIGLNLSRQINEDDSDAAIKIIEFKAARAREVAQMVPEVTVINGDALDPEILEEAAVEKAETVIAVTNDDEVNVLSSLLAKRSGAKRIITLVNNITYEPLISTLGVDVVVNPRAITVSTILQHVRRGRIRSVHSLGDGFGEIIEAEALETSGMVGRPLKDIKFGKGIIVGAILREGNIIMPRPSAVIQAGDMVVLLAAAESVKRVEKMFSVRLEYF